MRGRSFFIMFRHDIGKEGTRLRQPVTTDGGTTKPSFPIFFYAFPLVRTAARVPSKRVCARRAVRSACTAAFDAGSEFRPPSAGLLTSPGPPGVERRRRENNVRVLLKNGLPLPCAFPAHDLPVHPDLPPRRSRKAESGGADLSRLVGEGFPPPGRGAEPRMLLPDLHLSCLFCLSAGIDAGGGGS